MRSAILTIVGCVLTVALPARAEGLHPFLETGHSLALGGAWQEGDASLRATVGDLPEVDVKLKELGVDGRDSSLALEYRWRMSPRWSVSALLYTFGQSGSRTVQDEFNYDGIVFEAGVGVDTDIDMDTYIVDLMYSLYRSQRAELQIGGGIHALDIDVAIRGRAFVGGADAEVATAANDLLAPLPNLRAQAFYDLGRDWGVLLSAGWLSASYQDYDGSFTYAHPRIIYAPGEHLGFSLGYQFMEVDLTYTSSSRKESEYDVTFTGPTAVISYRF
ncbi:hypothetical protein E4634_10260 [Mangrovimicrobium sediminis]|uniref:Outer membrane protein beta-barrel domain-containing protein n=1 Tax=Mangrovimicrobium sediminis TaxID=2562682 RepID=A0A4Z0M207_9GAMM|nr:hypothetical protein [Haliea sp. SAOS-164]TGD73408.1 hypothetical protein E4634_10260 [Haliea sp. SAOS-164]